MTHSWSPENGNEINDKTLVLLKSATISVDANTLPCQPKCCGKVGKYFEKELIGLIHFSTIRYHGSPSSMPYGS